MIILMPRVGGGSGRGVDVIESQFRNMHAPSFHILISHLNVEPFYYLDLLQAYMETEIG